RVDACNKRRRMRTQRRTSPASLTASFVLASAVGCSTPGPASAATEPVCLDAGVDLACAPAYEPTYDALYTNTFQRSCAAPGVSCHAASGKQGAIDFSDADVSHANLLARAVRPGDPACSDLVVRVLSTSGKTRMPPGRSLTPGEQ